VTKIGRLAPIQIRKELQTIDGVLIVVGEGHGTLTAAGRSRGIVLPAGFAPIGGLMVKKRRPWMLVLVAALLAMVAVPSCLAYIRATRAFYLHAAPCSKLQGVPGLLQAAGFIPSGDCVVDVKKGGCRDARECQIKNPASGKSTSGHCTPSADKQSCLCIEK
jgi:hypothetical protein